MPRPTETVSRIYIKVAGQEVDAQVMNKILEVVVDQSLHLPNMFTILLRDPELKVMDQGPFDLTKEVEIEAADLQGTKYTLIKGEITALEPNFREGMIADLLVRGYDKSHRLHRGKKTRTFLNQKDSDIAKKIAGEVGLSPQVDSTSTVYDYVIQNNQTNMEFLHERAARIGFQVFADEGKLYFRKTPRGPQSIQLTWGQDLLSFRPTMTLSRQIDEVNVQGWDPKKLEAIIGKATSGNLYSKVQESKNGKSWASTFGAGKKIIVDVPVVSQAEANTLAEAHLDQISAASIM
jgi:phage protein D